MKGTIGIIGFSARSVTELSLEIVKYGNSIGLAQDQDFPEVLAIAIPVQFPEHLVSQARLCADFGCDIIAIPELGIDESMFHKFENIALLSGSIKDFAKSVFEKAKDVQKPKRPNLFFENYDVKSPEDLQSIMSNLAEDDRARGKRIASHRVRFGGYHFLAEKKIIAVLGGAGPLASADFCEKLTNKSVGYIHYSNNSAPKKNAFEMGDGPSYVPHYQNAVKFFQLLEKDLVSIHLAIPCNTAHKRLFEFNKDVLPVLDIRASVLKANIFTAEKFILLGTNRTIGLDVPDESPGVYEEFRAANYPDEPSFIVPDSEQQKKVMEAIYLVKAGNLEKAQELVLKVAQELRVKHALNIPVIAACTEIPLAIPFPKMAQEGFLDPCIFMSESAAQVCAFQYKYRASEEVQFSDHDDVIKLPRQPCSIVMPRSRKRKEIGKELFQETRLVSIRDSSSGSEDSSSSGMECNLLSASARENTQVDIDGVSISVFYNQVKNIYRIKAFGNKQDSEPFFSKKIKLLTEIKEQLCKLDGNPQDRLKGSDYVSIHSPKPEVQKRIDEWMSKNDISVIIGSPEIQQQRS